MRPLTFSVVTPSYNQGAFIERTVRSVLEQGVAGLDYLVVDGGSTDATLAVLERFADRLAVVSEPDDGQADAVNKGLARTTGELVGWLNSDDVYYPGALAAVRDHFAEHPEIDVVYGDADHIAADDTVIEPYPTEPWDPRRLEEVCYLCQPAVFFRRRVVELWGGLDADLDFCMDYEYWLRLARAGARFAHLPGKLAGSRLYATNKTLGQRVAVHTEMNRMLARTLGQVPDRWLANHAHALLEARGWRREKRPWRFAVAVSALTWAAALRWNRRISPALWATTWGWIRGNAPWTAASPAPPPPAPASRSSPPKKASPAPRRIGFDVSQTGTAKAGCGYVADSLLSALAEIDDRNEYVLYPTFGGDYWDPAGPEATRQIDHLRFRRGPVHATHLEARDFWQRPPADLERRLGDPDVVHAHNFFCPTTLRRARLVYTVHDLAFLEHPEWTTEANRQICFTGVFRASLHADLIVAVSEASRQHFLATFPHYPEERTLVAHNASRFTDRVPAERPAGLAGLEADRFFLNVGTIEPRKNQLRLLEAFGSYVARVEDPLPLVVAGGPGWLMDGFVDRARELGLEGRVRLLGYVEDGVLRWLYQACRAFLYPSLFEGFGLPVVEALSQGAAVLTSTTTSMPEVAGDAALLVDPQDTPAIAGALVRLGEDPALREALRERAPRQARRFSWRETAGRVLDGYERALSLGKFAAEPARPR